MAETENTYWIQRVGDFVTEMKDHGVSDDGLVTFAAFFVANAAQNTDRPLLAYEMVIDVLMGAAEDERQTSCPSLAL